jgi:hypothetical protein
VTPPTFQTLEMYINNLFIDPSLHDIYLERIGFSLTRVHRIQTINISNSDTSNLLPIFKWPLEYMFIGLRPAANASAGYAYDNWYKFTYNIPMTGSEFAKTSSVFSTGLTAASSTESYGVQTSIVPTETVSYYLQFPTISYLEISLQSIPLYSELAADFYNAYLPFQYGNYNITGTSENSSVFIPFNFYPNDNGSPNGHVNLSRSREFQVRLVSNVIGTNSYSSTGTAVHVGYTINFWIASSGNLYLRFT